MIFKNKLLNDFYSSNKIIVNKPKAKTLPSEALKIRQPIIKQGIYNNNIDKSFIDKSLIDRALKGNIISDAEGLKRSKNEKDCIYRYGNTVYISGTRRGPLDHEWTQNFKYIAKPIITDIGSKILGLKHIAEQPDIELNKLDRVKNTLDSL